MLSPEIFIYDNRLNLKGIVDQYSSFQGSRSLWEVGSCELHTTINDTGAPALKIGNILYIDPQRSWIIRSVEMREDEKLTLVVRGEQIKGILGQRLVIPDQKNDQQHFGFDRFPDPGGNYYYQSVDMSTQPIIPTESLEWFEVQGDEWGRNLVLESGVTRTNSEYPTHTYDLTGEIIIGETYTYQIKGTLKNGSHSWLFYNNPGYPFGAYYQDEKYDEIKDVYYQTFVATSTTSQVRIYSYPQADGEDATIDWVKLEKGSTATPWTPAPEDLASLKGKKYELREPLAQNEWHTLTVQGSFSPDAFVGVWAGDGFVGYLQDGKVTFRLTKDVDIDTLIIKSSDEQGEISRVQLEKVVSDEAVETIMKHYANKHAISPEDPDRGFPGLLLEPDHGRGVTTRWSERFKPLSKTLEDIGEFTGSGWDVEVNPDSQTMTFKYLPERVQTVGSESPVIFAVEYDNVARLNYKDSSEGLANLAYLGGAGTDEDRLITSIPAHDRAKGFDRAETWYDCGSLSNIDDLIYEGTYRLNKVERKESFTGDILPGRTFTYLKDWDLGSLVTLRSLALGLESNKKVTAVKESWEATGYDINVTFGKRMQNFIDEIKKSEVVR